MMRDFNCSICHLPESISMESEILPHKAIVTETKQLANNGDFVKLTSVHVRCLQHCHYKLFCCCCAGIHRSTTDMWETYQH